MSDVLARQQRLRYSVFGPVGFLVVRGPVECALFSDPSIASALNAMPGHKLWEEITEFVAEIVSPVLAFLWAKAEFGAHGRRNWLPFPHNLRLLYRASEWQEMFAQVSFVTFSVYVGMMLFRMHEILPLVTRLAQSEDTLAGGEFVVGALFGATSQAIIGGALSIYGSYRLGLIRYSSHSESQSPRPE